MNGSGMRWSSTKPMIAKRSAYPDVTELTPSTLNLPLGSWRWSVRQAFRSWVSRSGGCRERMRKLQRSRVLWLPSLQNRVHYHRRRTAITRPSNGPSSDVQSATRCNTVSGMGATGAGTTPRPRVFVAEFQLADAIFQVSIAENKHDRRKPTPPDAVLNE